MQGIRLVAPPLAVAVVLLLSGGCAQTPEPIQERLPCSETPGQLLTDLNQNFLSRWISGKYGYYKKVRGDCYRSLDSSLFSKVRISACDRLQSFHGLEEPVADSDRMEFRAELLANKCDALRLDGAPEAMDTCDSAVGSSATNPLARFYRGRLHADMEDWEEAITDFSASVDRSPCYLTAFLHRGYAYMALGQFAEAQTDLDKILAQHSDLLRISAFQQLLRYQGGDRQAALANLKMIGRAHPTYDGAHALLAQLLASEERFTEAIAAIDEAIRRDRQPYSPHWRIIRGNIRLDMGTPDDAIADFKDATVIDSFVGKSHFGLASALACSGRNDKALSSFEVAAIRLTPFNPDNRNKAETAASELRKRIDKQTSSQTGEARAFCPAPLRTAPFEWLVEQPIKP